MQKKVVLIIVFCLIGLILILGIVAGICLAYFLGIPQVVGEKSFSFQTKEEHVVYDDYDLFGEYLIPNGDEKYPFVIYAHGAESNYQSDMTTLKCLAKSSVAVYTFDFYGWSTRSKGPNGKGDYFKGTARGVDDAYEKQVIAQADMLDHVISQVIQKSFVDTTKVYLLGSSMGGATVAASSIHHSQDIKGIILQYPAINLVPTAMVDGGEYDVNQYQNQVLLLQGTSDVIVPLEMTQKLHSHYNKNNSNHAKLVTYDGQPHVFNGKYKVEAAKEIYRFLQE